MPATVRERTSERAGIHVAAMLNPTTVAALDEARALYGVSRSHFLRRLLVSQLERDGYLTPQKESE
jgi:hypothetical protein